MQDSLEAPLAPNRDFAQALLHGEASGYAVCAKPREFSRFPDSAVTTFAEISEVNCYYVFEKQEEAEQRLRQIPLDDTLGWVFSVKEVSYLRHVGPNDGPTLDPACFPFEMKGFVVDRSGTVTKWVHPGRFGWRGPPTPPDQVGPTEPSELSLRARIASLIRGLIGK
jgi:hypothetical protein